MKHFSNLKKIMLFAGIALLTACAEDDPAKYIADGKELFANEDYTTASLQFKNALQLDPQQAEAYYGLALIAEKHQEWPAMYANLQETVTVDPTHADAKIKLGQMYLLRNEREKASEEANSVLDLDPQHLKARILAAAITYQEGNHQQALQQVEHILQQAENDVEAIGLKASVLAEDKKYIDAVAFLDQSLVRLPDETGLRLLRIRYNTELNELDKVVEDFDYLLAATPDDNQLRSAQVDWLTAIGKVELAEKSLQDAIAIKPQDVELKLKLIDLLLRVDQQRVEPQLTAFANEDHGEDYRLQFRLAALYSAQNRIEEQLAVLGKIEQQDPTGASGLKARVQIAGRKLQQGDKAQAGQIVDDVLSIDTGENGALLLRAGLRLDQNNADGAISDLRIVLRDQPNAERPMVLMAQAYQLKGETEVAQSYWRKALEANPANLPALIAMSTSLLQRNELIRAEDLVSKAVVKAPNSSALLELMIQIKAAKKDWEGAELALANLQKLPQSHIQTAALSWQGYLKEQRGESDEAIKIYKETLERKPKIFRALTALVKLYNQTGKTKELTDFLQDFINKNPDYTQAYMLLATHYVDTQKGEEAIKILQGALAKTPENNQIKLNLGSLLAGQQRYQEAKKLFSEIVADDASTAAGQSAKLQLAKIAVHEKDEKTAASYYDEVLKLNPDNIQALQYRAGMNLDAQQVDAAHTDIQRILTLEPNAVQARNMLAQVYVLRNDVHSAELQWQQVLKRNPANKRALLSYADQLRGRGEFDKVESLLQNALQAQPDNPEMLEYLARTRIAKKDWAGAQTVIEQIKSKPRSEQVVDLLETLLASNQGDTTKEIEYFQGILEINPQADQALVGLVQSYEKSGQRPQLMTYLKTFIKKNPKIITAQNALGATLMAEKKWDDAEQILQQALSIEPKSASTYLVLAALLEAQGKTAELETHFKKALALMPDNYALNIGLARLYEQNRQIPQALALYDQLIQKFPESDDMVNNLADILVGYHDDKASIQRAKQLAERFQDSNNPFYLDTYGWVMLKSGETEKAVSALKKAVNTVPNIASMRYRLGEAYVKAGENNAALPELKKSLELATQQGEFNGIERARELVKQLGG